MSDLKKLEEHLRQINVPSGGIEYVLNAQSSPPSRAVQAAARNWNAAVPIPRLGVVLQAESLSGEFLFIIETAARDDVRLILDQTPSVGLVITRVDGRRGRTTYTPDFLVVSETAVAAIEVKPDGVLDRLCSKRPHDWRKHDDRYCYEPAVAVFSSLGLQHHVVHTSSLSAIRATNLTLLANAIEFEPTKELFRLKRKALQIVESEEYVSIGQIMAALEITSALPILQLLAEKRIYADLDTVLLSEPREVVVAVEKSVAKARASLSRTLSELIHQGAVISSTQLPNPKHHAELALRVALATNSSVDEVIKQRSERTIRRYKAALRAADGNISTLAPRWEQSGNREKRISGAHLAYLLQHIKATRSDPNLRTVKRAFFDYQDSFPQFVEATGQSAEQPVCQATFYRKWHQSPQTEVEARLQGGRRLSNAISPPVDPLTRTPLATRPFQVAHIDHWNVDAFVRVFEGEGSQSARRPWLTLMVDSFTDEVLGIWLSFSNPSRTSCAMVIRDCVARHQRLPEILVVDRGSEFQSNFFAIVLATLAIVQCLRPPEDPKYGKEVERIFGILKDQLARGIPGYGLSIPQSRAVSGAMKAAHRATLNLHEFFEILEAFLFKGFNMQPRRGELTGRSAARQQAMDLVPACGRPIVVDFMFWILTSIDAPSSEYKVIQREGLRVRDKWFTSERLRNFNGFKRTVSVRMEPCDDSIIYVYLEGKEGQDGEWSIATHSGLTLNCVRSEREVRTNAMIARDLRSTATAIRNEAEKESARRVREKLAAHSASGKAASPADADHVEMDFPLAPEPSGTSEVPDFDDVPDLGEEGLP